MARFESSRGKKDSRGSSPKRGSKGENTFEDHIKGKGRRYSGRENKRHSRDRREVTMTKVTCSECGSECEVPFKPTSTKPVYCDDCFAKKDKTGSNKHSNKDLEIINKKLDKIIKALEIE